MPRKLLLVLIASVSLVVILCVLYARISSTEEEGRNFQRAENERDGDDRPALPAWSLDARQREPAGIELQDASVKPPSAPAQPDEDRKSLLDMRDSGLFDTLAEMIASGDEEDRARVLEALREWLLQGEMQFVRWSAHALIVHGDPDHAVADLLECCRSVARVVESEGKNASGLFSRLGINVSMVIDEQIPKPEREGVPSFAREGFVQAMIRAGVYPESIERNYFLTVALGGSGDRHPEAMRFLADLVNSYEDPSVRDVAATNLGRIARVTDMLEFASRQLEQPPQREAEGLAVSGVLCGIYNAAAKHPEEIATAIPIFEEVLLEWSDGPVQDSLRRQVLGWLMSLKVRDLEDVYRLLSEDSNFPETASRARRALEALDGE